MVLVAPNGQNDKRSGKEVEKSAIAHFKVHAVTRQQTCFEGQNDKTSSGEPICRLRFEPVTSRI